MKRLLALIAIPLVLAACSSPPEPTPTQATSGTGSSQRTVEEPIEQKGISDGTYEVGVDIRPGKYKSAGGESCYWARIADDEGEIIDNALGKGPKVVTIKKGDYAFETSGCKDWFRQKK